MEGSSSSGRPRISARDLLTGGTGRQKTARDVAASFVAGGFVALVARRALKSTSMDSAVEAQARGSELVRDPARPARAAARIVRNAPVHAEDWAGRSVTVATLVLSALMAIQSRRRSDPG